jgi:hydroxymethylpyrimidine pyrophosphatase-like HAD family hydrolase
MTASLPTSTDGLAVLRQLSNIRLVAMDIDGTVLDLPTGQVADVIADLNRSLRHYRRGVTVTIATGRAFAGARPVIERLQLSRQTPIILYNGAVVCKADGSGFCRLHSLRTDELALVVKLTIEARLSALVYEPDVSLSLRGDLETSPTPLVERVKGFARTPGPPVEFNGLTVEWTSNHSEVPEWASAVVIPAPPGGTERLHHSLMEIAGISVTRSSTAYLEVRPSKANKGDALAAIAARRSLPPSSVLAIGDSDNDIEMLRWAGCSVAVANATPSVLAQSDYRTDGAAGQGVVETLRLLYDARRHRLRA